MTIPQDEKEGMKGLSRSTVELAAYLPDYIWEVANPINFGTSTAIAKMNDMLLAFGPNTPARDFGNHYLATGIMEREQPSIHETMRRIMADTKKGRSDEFSDMGEMGGRN